ncbi:hypothetical protein [Roseivirga thermotolerans]|uniref:hypothetical protein n=1 Tax=Roseivirga thermotolerans TaxID=1758176 RepID=UPI00273E854E|nr:hypothetical protein [Roseivirga thermotolerans]
MIKTFTQDDLVRYIYQETSEEENAEILSAMLFDDELAQNFHGMLDIVSELDSAMKTPSDKAIDAITSYSKSFHLHSVE